MHRCPIGVWVGPSGARLYGAPAQILAVADVTGMAPGARVGNVGAAGHRRHRLRAAPTRSCAPTTVGLSDARSLGVFKQRISDEGIATMVNMLDALDGYEENGVELDTTEGDGHRRRRRAARDDRRARFAKLGLVDQLFHTVASPPVAYLLLLIGLALLIFEFYTAGVGIAGVVGAVCTMLACYGLTALPTRTWAVALLVLRWSRSRSTSRSGIPRFWTGVGIVFTIVGSLCSVRAGPRHVDAPAVDLADRRDRRRHAHLHRRHAVDDPHPLRHPDRRPRVDDRSPRAPLDRPIDPEGTVQVGDGQWRARTNRATPIQRRRRPMRVTAIDGVTLEVEPLEGAAKDYREMRARSRPTWRRIRSTPSSEQTLFGVSSTAGVGRRCGDRRGVG